MDKEVIKEVVRATLNELIDCKLINKSAMYEYVLKIVNKRLYNYFSINRDRELTYILNQLATDPYIDIIYMHYSDRQTIERISEFMERDVSTIKRNKKRLIFKIYEMLNESKAEQ